MESKWIRYLHMSRWIIVARIELVVLMISLLVVLAPAALMAQIKHSYPLIGWQTFGGAVDDFYARFELVINRNTDVQWAKRMKQMHPGILLVPTWDWNTAQSPEIPNFPNEWWLRDSRGNQISAYGDYMMVNVTDLCPKAQSGPMTGMTYMEYLPIWLTQLVDLSVFDGVATDGLWGKSEMTWFYDRKGSEWSDLDIDNNGVNDHNEHSKDWFLSHWQAGIDGMLVELRKRVGTKLIIINSGSGHTWGWPQSNGIIVEKLEGQFDDKFNQDYWNKFRAMCAQPFVSLADGLPHAANPDVPPISKNDFMGMRFGLVTCMFSDVYFSFQDLSADEHYWSHWYDEFDVDLGQPTGPPRRIRLGLWARFFDKGVAIASVDGYTQTATDADLQRLAEYKGPYFRFRGSQDPVHNNGQKFTDVTLRGSKIDIHIFGDGIILLKQQQAVVSDLLVDNSDSGTSPGSSPAQLSGFTQQENCDNEGFYTTRCSGWLNSYGYAKAGPGSAQATFAPRINVGGNYEVFEWHPVLPSGATNVSYTITHANGSKKVMVNQRESAGRWNSLGTFSFNTGVSGKVVVAASDANGVVAADAIKFVYRAGNLNSDILPPAPPKGLRVN